MSKPSATCAWSRNNHQFHCLGRWFYTHHMDINGIYRLCTFFASRSVRIAPSVAGGGCFERNITANYVPPRCCWETPGPLLAIAKIPGHPTDLGGGEKMAIKCRSAFRNEGIFFLFHWGFCWNHVFILFVVCTGKKSASLKKKKKTECPHSAGAQCPSLVVSLAVNGHREDNADHPAVLSPLVLTGRLPVSRSN